MEILRQGDVVLIRLPARAAPKVVKPIKRTKGRVVIALGEVTGHAHAIADRGATLWSLREADRLIAGAMALAEADRLLRVTRPVTLRHEEHAPIELPPGEYLVRIQREYSPVEIRTVSD